ncbi:hypothetical protein K435DRAFT_691959 [Dendrothele bispora CBS 962.96]|uniref:Uncharacterized protein n=1 Tax=Dendrothele bispora (strain CBS 962.96) TaxID=1314807 RepID=A0A4S8L1S0_DENBC|nr:hypothetical protein K435DRAFT_691959 [Dendrothele bispora CBS 962.96]
MNDDGKIDLKRLNPFMVPYVPAVTGRFGCNTDGKFIGSGAFGMALSIYVASYTAKNSIDSAIMTSALLASLKAIGDPRLIREDKCRTFMNKTLNNASARRELSAQQVAASLLGKPNHYTDAKFAHCYWSRTLSWIAPTVFPAFKHQEHR